MKGTHLRFYTYENRKHGSVLMYEWLLEFAKRQGIHGGSAFRAIAGYGRHGKLHEQHFFELAGDVPVVVEFMVSDDEANTLISSMRTENVHLFYERIPSEFDWIDPSTP
jgi:PII-like signaling protein